MKSSALSKAMNYGYFTTILIAFFLFTMSCSRRDKPQKFDRVGYYKRIVSTSVAGDSLLLDVLPHSELDRVVGVSRGFENYAPDSIRQKLLQVSMPKYFHLDSVEHLILYQPDLVIASQWALTPEIQDVLVGVGIDLYVLSVPTSITSIHQQLWDMAVLLEGGAPREAEILIDELKRIEDRINKQVSMMKRIIPYSLRALTLDEDWYTSGYDTTFNIVSNLLQLENLGSSVSEGQYGYAPLTVQELLNLNPDIIFADSVMAGRLKNDTVFYSLDAVKHNLVIEINENLEKMFYSPTHHIIYASLYIQEEILNRLKSAKK